MEDDDTLKEALVADAREDLLEGGLARMTVEDEDDKNSSGDEENQPVPRPRPAPLSDVAAEFDRIEGLAHRGQMTEVLHHLRKAKLAWMRGAGSRKTTQTCIVIC